MHLLKVIEALDCKITGGSEYQWQSYGPNARWLDFETEHAHASVVFDSINQTVYLAEVNDINEKYAYRWLNPEFKETYIKECKEKNTDPNLAWDNKQWTDLEVMEDFLDKASAIMQGESFDNRIQVPLTLDDDELFLLFKMAHERDITLNEMVEIVLQEIIDRNRFVNGVKS